MTIAINDEHRELANVAHSFLAAVEARRATRGLLDAPAEELPSFWTDLAELGWLGLHIDEAFGGAGFGLSDLVIVLEALGRAAAPGPFLATVIGSAVIADAGTTADRTALLPGLVNGSSVAGVGLSGSASITAEGLSGDGGVVLSAGVADLLLVLAGDDAVVVRRAADGVTVTDEANLDPTRRCGRVRFDRVDPKWLTVLPGARPLALAYGRTLLAAEAVGGARECVEMSVSYAKTREQFGRAIGTYGPVKHHCANMFVATELATAAVWDAARAASQGREQLQIAAATAAALALPTFQRNAQLTIQVHGGIGFTWDHDAHIFLRRAAVLAALASASAAAEDVTRLADAGVQRRAGLQLPPEATRIRDDIRTITDEISALPKEAQRGALLDSGLAYAHWPPPWGRAAKAVEQLVIDEEIQRAGIERPRLGITSWILMTLVQHGTEDQTARWIRASLEGRLSWCQLFSEPDAGSDAAAIRTQASRVDGGWLVTGQKVWTSMAHEATHGLATVRTNRDAPKHAGITTMVIDMNAPGVDVRPLREATGSAMFNEVFLDEVFVPDDDVVGDVDAGWSVARSTLGNERITIGGGDGLVIGIDPLRAWRERRADVPGAQALVGELLAEAQALRSLNLRRAERALVGADPGPEGNVTKLLSAEHGQRSLDAAMALLGPEAALAEGYPGEVGRLYVFARQNSIGGGTSEISRNQIGERLLGLPRDPLVD